MQTTLGKLPLTHIFCLNGEGDQHLLLQWTQTWHPKDEALTVRLASYFRATYILYKYNGWSAWVGQAHRQNDNRPKQQLASDVDFPPNIKKWISNIMSGMIFRSDVIMAF